MPCFLLEVSKRNYFVALASRSQEKAQAYANEWRIPRAHSSYEALFAEPEIGLIYNPLPNHFHAEWTIKGLRVGKHVLCEKPVGFTATSEERRRCLLPLKCSVSEPVRQK